MTDGGRFFDHLGDMFLSDMGMSDAETDHDGLDEDEFCRIATEERLVSASELAAAREERERRPGTRVWRLLEERGAMDAESILAVFRRAVEQGALTQRTIDRYFVVDRLGTGATGHVYRAIHQDLFKHVALKVLAARPGLSRTHLERFRREATTAAGLAHEGIVGVHDIGTDGELHYIAMDLVEGPTLERWLALEPPLERRLLVLERVAEAVGHAHAHGVLHRDLKPQNVIVREGDRPVVVDFGLARALDQADLTLDGAVLGTPHYMAPEQLRGEISRLDARADVWALGVALFEAASGELPFPGASQVEVHEALKGGAPPLPDVPGPLRGPLEAILDRALQLDPADRYADAAELAEDLARARRGQPLAGASPWSRTRRKLARRAAVTLAAAALCALVGYGAWRGAAVLEERDRLEYVADLKSAYIQLQQRLEPVLDRADRTRYEQPTETTRDELVAEADAIIAAVGDETGVGEAYRGWVRWLVGSPDANAILEGAIARHPDNPIPPLIGAWRHMRRFAETEPWPVDQGVKLYLLGGVSEELAPGEVTEHPLIARAMEDLQRARDSRTWSRVPELAWVEDLCEGFELYNRGELSAAIAKLEAIGSWHDVEPNLILSFAYFRTGDDEKALRSAYALIERRPGLSPAVSSLASCLQNRGARSIVQGTASAEEAREDFAHAVELFESISPEPGADGTVASAKLLLVEGMARLGEDVEPILNEILETFDRSLEAQPDSYHHLTSRARARIRLQTLHPEEDQRELLRAAVEDMEAAHALAPDNEVVVQNRIGARFMALKHESRFDSEGSAERARALREELARYTEEFGEKAETLYYDAGLCVLLGDAARRAGDDGSEHYLEAIDLADRGLAENPNFADMRLLKVWVMLMMPRERVLPIEQVLSLSDELDSLAAGRSEPFPWNRRVAQYFKQLSLSPAYAEHARALLEAALERMDRVVEEEDDAEAHLDRSRTYLDLCFLDHDTKWIRGAQRDAERATELTPDAAAAWLRAALVHNLWCVRGYDHDDELEAAVSEALRSDPESALALALQGLMRVVEGDQEAALSRMQDAHRLAVEHGIDSDAVLILNNSAWSAARVPPPAIFSSEQAMDYDHAQATALCALSLASQNSSFMNTWGVALYRTGDFDRAVAILERSDELNSSATGESHPADLAFLCMAHHRRGETEKASALFEELDERMKLPAFQADAESLGFFEEAKTLLRARARR